jgi:hypothetical protein
MTYGDAIVEIATKLCEENRKELEANIETLRELIEKATPKKPIEVHEEWNKFYYVCPTCGKLNSKLYNINYCDYCGQKFYCSEDEDYQEGEKEEN